MIEVKKEKQEVVVYVDGEKKISVSMPNNCGTDQSLSILSASIIVSAAIIKGRF